MTEAPQTTDQSFKSFIKNGIRKILNQFNKGLWTIFVLLLVLLLDVSFYFIYVLDKPFFGSYYIDPTCSFFISIFIYILFFIFLFVCVAFIHLFNKKESRNERSFAFVKKDSKSANIKTWIKILYELLENCWKWIKTNYISIVFAFAFILIFMYFEERIVEVSFSLLSTIRKYLFGIIFLWVLWSLIMITIIYFIVQMATNNTLFDGRTVFLSIAVSSLFAYCAKKYPWETLDLEIDNPIYGSETAFLLLFIQYGFCFLVFPFIQYIKVALLKETYKNTSKCAQTGDYLIDSPITSIDKDELFFGSHVLALEKRIVEIPNNGSHSIAITGGWGTGKTSFLKLLEQKLKGQHLYEIMWFNPLKSSKSGNIQNDFFDVLESTLSKYKLGFGRRIKYYKELIGAIDNKYVSFLVKLGSIQLEEEKQRINDIVKMIPKKIIIIIDDVDRLKGDEIMQVFKLVSFNAEFDNVVFLLPLDKGNVIKALGCDANYPNKFFEMEFPLPDNHRYFTCKYVHDTLKTLLKNDSMNKVLDNQTISDYTSYCINNMRDAKRFINNFIDRFRMIHNILDVRSYYLLSLIQYKDPVLYEKIRAQNKELLEKTADKQYLVLIEDGCSEMEDILKQMLQDLFPPTKQPEGKFIYHLDSFPLYFNDSSTKVISDVMMLKILLLDDDSIEHELNMRSEDKIIKQSLVEALKRMGKEESMMSILDNKDSERIIKNYYKAYNILQHDEDNGLTYHEGLAPVKIGRKKYAFVNEQGVFVFTFKCDLAFDFSEGLARVRQDNKFGFINNNGEVIIPCNYTSASDFSKGFARVTTYIKKGTIDTNGVFLGKISREAFKYLFVISNT